MVSRTIAVCILVAFICQSVAGRNILQDSSSPTLPSSTSTSANPGNGTSSSSGAAEGGNPNSATTTSSSSAPSSSSASGSATGPNGTSTTSAAASSPQSVTYYCGSGLISLNLGCNSGTTQPLEDLVDMYSSAEASSDGNVLTCSPA